MSEIGPTPVGYLIGMAAMQLVNAGIDPAEVARARNRARYRHLPRTQDALQATWQTMVMAARFEQSALEEEVHA